MKKQIMIVMAALFAMIMSSGCSRSGQAQNAGQAEQVQEAGQSQETGKARKSGKASAEMGLAVIATIMSRTSVRAYTDEPVKTDDIELLLRAGMAAPTAVNKQPWHFVAVTNRAKLDELATANPNAKMLTQAPLAIIVCGDMEKTLDGPGREFWIQDCSAATENILLAAHALGLGAVWTALYPMDERIKAARNVLELPGHLMPLCTIVIGHPAQQPEPKDKWKPENVTYIR